MSGLRRFLAGTTLSLILALIALSGASSSPTTTHAGKIRRGMDKLVAAGAPGVIVVFRDGDEVIRLARGFADVARKRSMRADDRFRIASLTKSFIAAIVLQLTGEGRLSLDDTVETHLPGFVPNGEMITIRHLMNHTSGVFDFYSDQNFFKQSFGTPPAPGRLKKEWQWPWGISRCLRQERGGPTPTRGTFSWG